MLIIVNFSLLCYILNTSVIFAKQHSSVHNDMYFLFYLHWWHILLKNVLCCRFYGKNSSYVHGGLTSNGDPAEAVYGQAVINPG